MIVILIILIALTNIYFAVKCIEIAKQKNRSNNAWVTLASTFGVIAYIIIKKLPEVTHKDGEK